MSDRRDRQRDAALIDQRDRPGGTAMNDHTDRRTDIVMEDRNPIRRTSIQSSLILVMISMMAVILGVNLLIFHRTNRMVEKIDAVFASNADIGSLTDTLEQIQTQVGEYLDTKSTYALENYYRYENQYRELISELNDRNVDNGIHMLEKNIRSMSETYLDKTAQTVQAKRGRNVERYRLLFQDQTKLYRYITQYIYRLNVERFAQNSDNYRILLSSLHVMEFLSVSVIVLVLILSLIYGSLMVHAMIRPLRDLAAAANEVAEGNFDVSVPQVNGEDEVAIVADAFSKMLASIQENISRIKAVIEQEAQMKERELAMEAHLREAQLKYFQAQINPHFLFNCLNAGAQLAMLEDAEATGSFMEKMADFFRYNVQKMDRDASLAEEIASVDNYIYILNVRYSGDITYRKEIAPDVEGILENIRMPSMILQPIVENAVSHGIHDDLEHGLISLSVEREPDTVRSLTSGPVTGLAAGRTQTDPEQRFAEEDAFIRIQVRDNGAGMTHDQIQEAMADETTAPSGEGTAGIAVRNVNARLRLYYDREQLMSIHSEGKGQGTEVTILLPLE